MFLLTWSTRREGAGSARNPNAPECCGQHTRIGDVLQCLYKQALNVGADDRGSKRLNATGLRTFVPIRPTRLHPTDLCWSLKSWVIETHSLCTDMFGTILFLRCGHTHHPSRFSRSDLGPKSTEKRPCRSIQPDCSELKCSIDVEDFNSIIIRQDDGYSCRTLAQFSRYGECEA